MPRKKKETIEESTVSADTTSTATTEVPATGSRAGIEIPVPVVINKSDQPRIIGGVCEYCGTGAFCIHYPELNAA